MSADLSGPDAFKDLESGQNRLSVNPFQGAGGISLIFYKNKLKESQPVLENKLRIFNKTTEDFDFLSLI